MAKETTAASRRLTEQAPTTSRSGRLSRGTKHARSRRFIRLGEQSSSQAGSRSLILLLVIEETTSGWLIVLIVAKEAAARWVTGVVTKQPSTSWLARLAE